MNEQALLDELLDLAEKIGLEIRNEFLGGDGGGLCRLRGKWVLFVDTGASRVDQLARTASAIANSGELENRYILPQIREILEQYR